MRYESCTIVAMGWEASVSFQSAISSSANGFIAH